MLRHLLLSGTLILVALGIGRAQEEPAKEAPPPAHKVPALFKLRAAKAPLRSNGGNGKTEAAVAAALDWLARHQNEDGSWDCDGFGKRCEVLRCKGKGYSLYDPGVSGLAVLAFLGAGVTPSSEKHGKTVERGLRWLLSIQDEEGCYGPRTADHYVYCHAIATIAVTEAFALTGDEVYGKSARKAVAGIQQIRNPDMAWRYGMRPGDNDTSVTGWMIAALRVAKAAGLETDPAAFEGGRRWVEKVTDPETFRVGYNVPGTGAARPSDLLEQFPGEQTASLEAIGVLIRLNTAKREDAEKRKDAVQGAVARCLRIPPRWEGNRVDLYYWYHGTLALFRVGGKRWKAWNKALQQALLPNQRTDGCAKGSWDAVGPWSRDGGRVYSTAICALMLETYYRYRR